MLQIDRAVEMLRRLPIRDRLTRRIVPFELRHGQQVIADAMRKQQQAGQPIRIIILKARRVGGSSFTDGLGVLHGISKDAAIGLIVAHLFKSSKGLFEVPANLIDRSLGGRPSLGSMLGITHTSHEITIPRTGGSSTLSLATAGSVAGAGGRALSFTFLHLSEAAYFPGQEPFTSLLPTVPYDPETMIVIESTANGRSGIGAAFYDYWQKAAAGQIDYAPVFIPWHSDPTYIRPAEQAEDAPADDYEKWLMEEFHCTPAQIAWWRATLETECKGDLKIMQQEYPASPEEAFMATGDPAFERDELSYVRNLVCDPKLTADLRCTAGGDPNSPSKPHYLDPVLEERSSGDWLIYHLPIPGHEYFIGSDAARGLQIEEGEVEPTAEGDFASSVIWDGNTGDLAARMAKRVNPERLAAINNAAGRFYNLAMINVELTGNLGLWSQKVLRDTYHYPNLYRWRGTRDDRISQQNQFHKRLVIGWETTVRTREMMMDAFRAGLRSGTCKPYDRALLAQMENATRKEGFRWEVIRGHDDILMAAGIGWIAREQWGPPIGEPSRTASGSTLEKADELHGTRYVDDTALQLARHYHSILAYNRRKGLPQPLEGI